MRTRLVEGLPDINMTSFWDIEERRRVTEDILEIAMNYKVINKPEVHFYYKGINSSEDLVLNVYPRLVLHNDNSCDDRLARRTISLPVHIVIAAVKEKKSKACWYAIPRMFEVMGDMAAKLLLEDRTLTNATMYPLHLTIGLLETLEDSITACLIEDGAVFKN